MAHANQSGETHADGAVKTIRPTEAIALFQLGNRQMQAQDLVAAEQSLRGAIALNPRFPQAYAALGYLLQHLGDHDQEVEELYRKAISQAPRLAQVYINLGVLLLQQKRLSDAEAAYANALALDPRSPAAWSNLGSLYISTKREEDAEICLQRAVELDPNARKARFNRSYLKLRRGKFDEGWELFEAREWYVRFEKIFAFPRWQGCSSLAGKSLLLCLEAGHGDVIQFCRYTALLKALGTRHITLLCHPALERLMRTLDGLDEIVSYTNTYTGGEHDYWMPLLSAPYQFHSPQTRAANDGSAEIYARIPYLHADAALCAQWAPKIPQRGKRVGLAWHGNPKFENDRDRSLPGLHTLLPLWEVPGLELISLQKGHAESQALDMATQRPLTCLGHEMTDFADAAAIISQLDLVISVDTAMAHLAGALGKPCWLLLPDYMTDWRWGIEGTHSDWYPGVLRLFRQGADGQWPPVITQLVQALREQN